VGDEGIGVYNFHVHESIICRVDFFRVALQGGFKEASTKLIKMPEDDPRAVACLVEFLYTGSYLEPVLTGEKGGLVDYKSVFIQELYHARVLVLAEKYCCQALCITAAKYLRRCGLKVYPPSYPTYFLEYLIHLYDMSGPGSTLRIVKINDQGRIRPDVWYLPAVARWIGVLWRDPVGRPLVEEASKRCPDLGEDIEMLRGRNFLFS